MFDRVLGRVLLTLLRVNIHAILKPSSKEAPGETNLKLFRF